MTATASGQHAYVQQPSLTLQIGRLYASSQAQNYIYLISEALQLCSRAWNAAQPIVLVNMAM